MLMASILPKRFVKQIFFDNNNYLFTGNGGHLLIFENLNDHWTKIGEYTVFHEANIYGFDKCESTLCIYGEKYFSFASFISKRLNLDSGAKRYFAVDWIWHALFLDPVTVAFLLGHNNVRIFNRQSGTFDLSIQCDENCLLYSGIFIGKNLSNLCVLAGSVFNDILFWTPTVGTRVVHRLQKHEGVVFGLNFCPIRKLLCSTSDDRSCRIWKFECSQDLLSNTRPLLAEEWSLGYFVQIYVFYGHEARVWNASWIPESVMVNSLVTVGEDGCINLWNCNLGLTRSWKTSRGSIHSVCFDEINKDLICGSDSGSLFTVQLSQSSTLKYMNFAQDLLQGEGIVELCFCKDSLLCVSNKGCVLIYDYLSGITKPIVRDENLRYACSNKSHDWIAIGGLLGTLYLFPFNDLSIWRKLTISKEKLCSVHFVDEGKILLCCTAIGQILFCKMGINFYDISLINLTLQLPDGRHRWFTCSLLIRFADCDTQFVICGDRNGSVCFFEIDLANETYLNQTVFSKTHGVHGVTDLLWQSTNVVHSIGRDGTWRQYEFNGSQWILATSAKVSHGFEWPSKFLKLQEKLMIAGFKGNNFTLYDTENRQFLCLVECGGGHRSYDMKIGESNLFLFLFAKAGQLCLAEIDIGNEKEIIPSFHSRHVNQAVLCQNSDKSKVIFAACSEDSTVSIWSYAENKVILLQRLKTQTSGVHCLVAVDYFLISGGSRSEICLWHKKENQPYILVGRYCDSERCDARYLSLNLATVNSSNILCAARSDGLLNFLAVDFEAKLISKMCCFARADCCLTKMKILSPYWCFVIGTNGTLYILNLNTLDQNSESSPQNNSKLKENSKKKKNSRKQKRMKSKNTYINNDSGRQISWDLQLHLADNGLTALDVRFQTLNETVCCLCGSESGALSMAIIQLCPKILCLNRFTYSPWHVSTVVDVAFVDQSCALSLSVDQRLCSWFIDESSSEIVLTHRDSKFSHVSDPASFCCLYDSKQLLSVLITGSGLQILPL